MSNHSDDMPDQTYFVSSSFLFGGREFEVKVAYDGFSYWFDPIAEKLALKDEPELMVMAGIGDENARRYLSHIREEFALKALVPEKELRVIREELSPAYWAEEFPAKSEKKLDAILEPIFWEYINPQLSSPVERPV